MSDKVERFGAYLAGCLPDHPERFRRLVTAAYRLISLQTGHFPSGKRLRSREYIQSFTAGLMADMISDAAGTAVVNIFLPCEIFHALGIRTAVPEALATYISCTACEKPFIENAEKAGAPPSFCSYHKILMGLAGEGISKKPLMIANTSLACDANQLSFRYLAGQWHVPHVVIDVPQDDSADSVAYVADQLRAMAKTAGEASGKKLDEAVLKAAVARSIRTQRAFSEYLSRRAFVHLPEALSPELLNVMAMHPYLGLETAETYVRMLNRDIIRSPKITTQKKILWMHVLPNNLKSFRTVFQGADNRSVEIVGCDMTYDALVPMDEEKPYESMARRIAGSSFNGPGSRRIEATLQMARQMKADGILIFCQWGCKQTQGLSFTAKKVFEEEGFPTLVLDSDGCDRANAGGGQVLTRVQAFLEQIGARL